MARPKKQGLDYFPLDVDIFSNREVRAVMARYGSDGFALYAYVLCEAYKENGYYLVVDDDWEYFAAKDLGMSRESVKQVMTYFFGRSLLAKKTLNGGLTCKSSTLAGAVTIITSAGIQRRYQLAVAERARKSAVEVDGRIWLLKNEETESFIKVTGREGFSGKNEGFSGKNEGFSAKNDIKESKVKESKVKESTYTPAATDVWLDQPDVNAAFIRYIGMRAGGGKLMKAQVEALKEQLLAMAKDPAEQIRIIDQSTRAGWKSFYPVDERGGQRKAGQGQGRKPSGAFWNFDQRNYDYAALEKELLGGGA